MAVRRAVTMAAGLSACVAGVILLGGCIASSDPGVSSRDPAKRVEAMVDAASAKDAAAVPGLVARLDSQDGGERLLAITAIKRITGETLGYDYAAPMAERNEAIERWRAWLDQRTPSGAVQTPPAR